MSINKIKMNQNKLASLGVIAFVVIILLILLSNSLFVTIDAGYRGVLFKRLGGGLDMEGEPYKQGFHVIAPWNKLYVYDVRISQADEKMQVLSKNGLNITIDISYRYQPNASQLAYLHNEVGSEFQRNIVIPDLKAATREIIGKYLPEELYSSKRETIQTEIFERTRDAIENKHIILDAVLIKDIGLPETVKSAIEEKLKAEQTALKFEYILDQERKEAERKVIEARAKSEANELLNKSLTENILRDKGIEATLEIAKSPNSKVVIIGGGEDGMPLILGN